MNTVVTSKEQILKASRELIRREGWSAVNIRSVAAGCGVSVGSIYNYFDSKADLIGAVVESVWCEIFHRPEDAAVFQDTQACVTWLYGRMEYGAKQYPWILCPSSRRICGRRSLRWEEADAAGLAAHAGRTLFCFAAGCQHPAGRLYGTVYGGELCGSSVFPDALGTAAAGVRSRSCTGDDPQDALLAIPHNEKFP